MLLDQRGLTIGTVANVAAAAAFVHFASWTWLEPNLRGQDVALGGDAIIWGVTAFPILMVAAIANLIWLLMVAWERQKSGVKWPSQAMWTVGAVWLCTLTVDHLRGLGY